jgi:hypothetical protein
VCAVDGVAGVDGVLGVLCAPGVFGALGVAGLRGVRLAMACLRMVHRLPLRGAVARLIEPLRWPP